ncbi:MAG: ATP-binding protein [Alphaproteobacteria bacterium]|nr:ATP-binding protein [Alphaproteobacteria bacterium]
MLIEFRVRNFRSIRDEQVLSMVANGDTELQDSNTSETGLSDIPRLVRSAAIYGANASGKSNLIKAMIWMQDFIKGSIRNESNEPIDNQPFLLDHTVTNLPSLFEMTFTLKGIEYRYGFEVTAERVIAEYLLDFANIEPNFWIKREYDSETATYDFVTDLGEGEVEELWRKSTKHDSLFLSVAVQLNSEKLEPFYEFLAKKLKIRLRNNMPLSYNRMLLQRQIAHADSRNKIVKFLQAAGILVEDIQIQKGKRRVFVTSLEKDSISEDFTEVTEIKFLHQTEKGNASIDLREESDGTIRLFSLAGRILDVLESGNILVHDELDASLHSHLVEWIIKLFHSPETNPLGAQLIFTTHNNSIMTEKIFRRDQIWFVDKDRDEATKIIPLTDFHKDDHITLPEGYLEGRYGALPYLSDYKGK